MKNEKRQSRGVAFVQFLKDEDAESCTTLNETEMFGRTLKVSIAKDNGRCTEFGAKWVTNSNSFRINSIEKCTN